ncbi:GNAT family N-acetyltransferase [Peribacillus sp. SCS-37]|uniref:GNAT family N-acetyltransferase n=1 Tax=Paraperibacillus esterisolvens TaxID=3115296 RepID=UPI003905B53C
MIRLAAMNAEDFQKYLTYAIEQYANEHVKSGNWKEEEAYGKAAQEYDVLLPDGEKTANHHLFTVRDGEQDAGMIWLAEKSENRGFIFDINIWEEYQGRGYGKKAMEEIEIKAKELGLKSIALHVFGHNGKARELYEKLGYIITNINMKKEL